MKAQVDRSQTILFVDDDSLFVDVSAELLRARGFVVETAGSLESASAYDPSRFGCVLVDHNLPDGDGLSLAARFDVDRTRVVMMSASKPFDAAVGALRLGVADFLSKPLDLEALVRLLDPTTPRRRPGTEVAAVPTVPSLARRSRFLNALGRSRCPVLITGETGSGKGFVSRTIHELGGSSRPFVAVNCAAIPATLIEGELFGVERGAFTGAEARPGIFEQGHGGTVLLDEIGELPLAMQAKLLSFLDERSVRRVGGTTSRSVDVRILATTNRDIDAAAASGEFRSDLFYRLDVARFEIEPLRERLDDLPLLVGTVIEALSSRDEMDYRLADGELEALVEHTWPGNVRELRNVLERSTLSSSPDSLTPSREIRRANARADQERDLSLEKLERAHVLRVLELCEGNRTMAANALGMGLSTLRRKLADWAKE